MRMALLLGVALAGCIAAELDVPDFCASGLPLDFPAGGRTARIPVAGDDFGVSLEDDEEAVGVQMVSIAIGPLGSGDAFASVERAQVVMLSLRLHAGVLLAELDHHERMPDGTLYIALPARAEVAEYLRAGDAVMEVGVEGELSGAAWAAEMDVCVHRTGRDTSAPAPPERLLEDRQGHLVSQARRTALELDQRGKIQDVQVTPRYLDSSRPW